MDPSLVNPPSASPSANSSETSAPTGPPRILNSAQQPELTDWGAIIQQTAAAVAREVALAFRQSQPTSSSSSACCQVPSQVLAELVSSVPTTNGESPMKVIYFLCHFRKIAAKKLADDARLAMLFLPRTTQQLRVLWSQFITDCHSSADIIALTFQALVPARVRHTLTKKLSVLT